MIQDEAPAFEYRPNGQIVQVATPPRENSPAAHSLHEGSAEAAYRPGGQIVHAAEPALEE